MQDSMAHVARRVAAYLLDIVILVAVLAPLGWAVQRVLGIEARTGPEVWRVILINMSLPMWLYFTLSEQSAWGGTIGKRVLGLRVTTRQGERIGLWRALGRTAIKLLPWEMAHTFAFALSPQIGDSSPVQSIGLIAANVLTVVYLAVTAATGGRRSVHDLIMGTEVARR